MKKIVVANNKGGVGKTTIASQIVFSLAGRGHSVIAVDLDSQRNLTSSFEHCLVIGDALDMVLDAKPFKAGLGAGEINVIAGHKDLQAQNTDDVMVNVSSALSNSNGADFCVIDTPPSFGDVVYGALLGADYLLVPIELKKYSLDGIEMALEAFIAAQAVNDDLQLLGFLPSRFDAVKQVERDALAAVAAEFEQVVIRHQIRNRVAYVVAQEDGVPLSEIKTKSGKGAQEEFGAFFDWLYGKVNGGA
ncbi:MULTISPECIES: ParA family protein [Roseobacteraceae]|uniref:Sporulation initiation inhibitor protein Soj n=1 Tax=Pseudosulfitobacter pseudonitzschiae TaxID=1402135 RepID=A0A221K807_9RHOB|nr:MULTISPECIES: ParA family protein [Roseobacteraceae]ASM75138.1 sporulation initiation inhibitor protein Soj [Pseudosulfitobacter pseudonitzschiae]